MKGYIARLSALLKGRRDLPTAAGDGNDPTAPTELAEHVRRRGQVRWIGFPMALMLGATLGWAANLGPVEQLQLDAREQYYRGVYDVCRSVLRYPDDLCKRALRNTVDHNWFEDPTPGWVWPLPDAQMLAEPPARIAHTHD